MRKLIHALAAIATLAGPVFAVTVTSATGVRAEETVIIKKHRHHDRGWHRHHHWHRHYYED